MVFSLGLPNMDSKDIEEIFKGVLTDESQESQESSVFSVQTQPPHPASTTTPLVSPSPHPGRFDFISSIIMFQENYDSHYTLFSFSRPCRYTSNNAYTETSSTWYTAFRWSV